MTFVMFADAATSVPLSQVKKVKRIDGERLRLTMQDGSEVETHEFQWAYATQHQFQSVIPAAPGTLLICTDGDEDYAPKYFEPVVGWGVMSTGNPRPLTHYGVSDEYDPHVLHPDGRVTNAGGGVFKSLEEYLGFLAEAKSEAQAA